MGDGEEEKMFPYCVEHRKREGGREKEILAVSCLKASSGRKEKTNKKGKTQTESEYVGEKMEAQPAG